LVQAFWFNFGSKIRKFETAETSTTLISLAKKLSKGHSRGIKCQKRSHDSLKMSVTLNREIFILI